MLDEQSTSRSDILTLTTEIVSAHISNNLVELAVVSELIQMVFEKLSALVADEVEPTALTPAVPIKRSVTDEYLVCLEDGKKLKMLKRHLMTSYDMTPDQYRAKWGLAKAYPMVAPASRESGKNSPKRSAWARRSRWPPHRSQSGPARRLPLSHQIALTVLAPERLKRPAQHEAAHKRHCGEQRADPQVLREARFDPEQRERKRLRRTATP